MEFKQHIHQLLKVDVSDAAIKNLFNSVNKGSDDYITLDEWLDTLDATSLKDVGDEELKNVVAQIDTSGDGKISLQELKVALKKFNCTVSDDELEAMFESADTSKDGRVSIEEFSNAFYNEIHG